MGKRQMVSAESGKSEHETAQRSRDDKNLYWQDEIMRARKRSKTWRKRASDTLRVYRNEGSDDDEVFNILWSNTETLKGAVYSHTPRPEVTRTFLEQDKIGNTMAMVMERALSFCQQIPGKDFDAGMEKARDDYLLAGRGVVRVCYEADFEEKEVGLGTDVDPESGEEISVPVTEERKIWEEAYLKFWPWDRFEHSDAEEWEAVWWVAFARDMRREELVEEFGEEIGREIPLNGELEHKDWEQWIGEEELDLSAGLYDWYGKEDFARVWEIWDKGKRVRIWIAEGMDDIIREDEDPYRLVEFFPCPKPLYSIETSGTLTPIPEYTQYQYQAEELNIITRRLARLTDGLKARGVCDADIHSLTRLFDADENAIIPDEDYGKLMASGGIENAVSWLPISIIADVIAKLRDRRADIKDEIYELTGISDILRGQSDPRETATAVRTKGRFGTLRVQQRQKRIQKFARDALRLMGELVAEFFDRDTLILMAAVENKPAIVQGMDQIMEKFRNDAMRSYTIDIETDSTIAINEAEQKQDVQEFFMASSELLKNLIPAVQQGVLPMPAAKAMFMYAASRFNAGRDLMEALEMIGSQPQGDPQQNAQMQAQQAKMVMDQKKLQLEEMELKFKVGKAQMEAAIEQEKLKLEYAKLGMDFEETKLKEQVKLATAKMDIEAAKANRRAAN